MSSIAHGAFAEAWRLNPFGYLFFALLVVVALGPVLRRAFPDLETQLFRSRVFRASPVLLVVAMFAFGLCRIVRMAQCGWNP